MARGIPHLSKVTTIGRIVGGQIQAVSSRFFAFRDGSEIFGDPPAELLFKPLQRDFQWLGRESNPACRRMAWHFHLKSNELANRMIGAGILALEREDADYEPDFVIEYRQKVVIPRIEQFQGEQKIAEHFNPYSDVPKELESDGWAFMGLMEATNLYHRELVQGLLEGKTVQESSPGSREIRR